jgi:hypothetical protein
LPVTILSPFDLVLSPFFFQPPKSFPESSGNGRGFLIGLSYPKEAYTEGGDGGRKYLDVSVELEERDVALQVRDKDDDA